MRKGLRNERGLTEVQAESVGRSSVEKMASGYNPRMKQTAGLHMYARKAKDGWMARVCSVQEGLCPVCILREMEAIGVEFLELLKGDSII
jgi:hypothetical protein